MISLVKERKNATKIAAVCITAYLINYVVKSILSICTPQMINKPFFSKEYIGLLSSICFIFYACGQLLNGFIGDTIHPRYMIFIGLLLSGLSGFAVPIFQNRIVHFICFALIGYGSSMLRGPLTKIISENTDVRQAQIICTLLNMAVFAGPLIASFFSMFFNWRTVFFVAGTISFLTSIIVFILISLLSANGKIDFKKNTSQNLKCILGIFKLDDFVFYMAINGIGEIAGTSITFWIPTYLKEHLSLTLKTSSVIYSFASLSTLFAPFLTLIIYDYFIKDGVKLSLIMYLLSGLCFVAVRIPLNPAANIAALLLAKFFASCAVGVVWSVYIPSLASSGRVSSANGLLDAFGYLAAAVANLAFSGILKLYGWKEILTAWYIIMFFGVAVAVMKSIRINFHGGKSNGK